MEIVTNILIGIYLLICLVLIVLILKQGKDDSGASGTIVGGSSNNFYEKNKGRTKEGRIKRMTVVTGVLSVVLAIVLSILFVM